MNGKYGHLKIGTSPLTGDMFLGRLNKKSNMWLDGKTNITEMAVGSVMEHLFYTKQVYTSKFLSDNKKRTLALLEEDELEITREHRRNKKIETGE